jgi:uncharacterized integral membrane protein (TIGR00697 family)
MEKGTGSAQSVQFMQSESVFYSRWFMLLTSVFITSLITSNVIASKLVSIWSITLPASIVIFPISYIAGDVLTEIYDYSKARQVIWLGFFCNSTTTLAIWCAQILPPAPFWTGQLAYEQILGYTPRLLTASFLAYLAGEFANSFVLAKMKIATRRRCLWMRTIGSTIVGQGLDSAVFITLAFFGNIPLPSLWSIILAQWVLKSLYELSATPMTYIVVNFLKKKEGSDAFDDATRFNPLLFFK